MTTSSDEPLDAQEMLQTMEARIRAHPNEHQRSLGLIALARDRLWQVRQDPIGGRLLRLKRIIFWFTASAFDRHAKVQEAVLDALDEVGKELVDIRNRLAVRGRAPELRAEPERSAKPAD